MGNQVALDKTDFADNPEFDEKRHDGTHQVVVDVAYKRLILVNVVFYGLPGAGEGEWVLVDTGIPGSADAIVEAANERFTENARPAAIIMTHGHFDHIGSLEDLSKRWNVPIYAHELELPYLNGQAAYPPPDPGVGGGLMSLLSPLFPRGPINVSQWLQPLPTDFTVPGMPGWRWIHTPGHTPGHISLWRAVDKTLLSADAFITTAQESAYAALTQEPEMHGPPMYFTQDWEASRVSVEKLAALEPEVVVAGHGRAMRGPDMRNALHILARDFDRVAVPEKGRYVKNPAQVETGTAYVPAKK